MKGAWVTLATNDSYSLGALVLAHSLRQVGTIQELAILVTPGVTNSMRTRLSEVFNLVKEVNVLDSRDQSNLRLLQRPELGITFTKLHCWQLTQYEKCVFLDADTLVLQNCDELFDKEEFSAAPDVGWPDCFNSGVFVYRPSGETYDKLIQFALEKGSFDGGDQGLLNLFFSDWSHKDISKHLPFIYNVCSTAFYSYLPAFKQFGKDVKILHFIGNAKPWLQYFDTASRRVRPSGDVGHLSHILQKWWDIFCHMVHPRLTPDMSGLAGAFANLVLGQQRTAEQEALESNLRRQNWEQGNIDYLGKDSFDNIWRKICETLSKGPQKEKTAEGPEIVPPADLNVGTEQQVEKETQPSQGLVTEAETSKEEHQPCETKESCVVPTPAEEIDTSPPKEDVCALPVSEKASEVVLEVTKIASSEPPSKTPIETPVEIVSAPVIPSDVGCTPILSTLPQTEDVGSTNEKQVTESASIQIKSAVKESPTAQKEVPEIAPVSTAILQEIVSQQTQLPEKTNETLPMIPQAPTKFEEANQVISVSEKVLESEIVPSKEESQDPTVAVPCVPKSPDTTQTPILAEEQSSVPSPVAEAHTSPDAKDPSSILTPTLVQAVSSPEVQIPTPDEPTPISQTPLHGQSSDQSSISPRKDVIPSEGISPPGDIALPTKIPCEEQISPPKQLTTQPQIPAPTEISSQSQTSDKDLSATSTPSCTEKSVTAEAPVKSAVKISTSPLKPDTSVQLKSTAEEIASKESQTSKPHDAAVSSKVPTETKQAVSSPSATVEACPIAPPPRKSGGTKKQGKSKK
ncbi:hypothetical protein WA026_004500 [Henosepilachna vigintioctopunctata]|uniref:glycogenin glucosyltransferase n=1 Tax=Henosepilachna vigintioctopunctata TaxID=420089 RepID=A0AAW1V932_9CUCU